MYKLLIVVLFLSCAAGLAAGAVPLKTRKGPLLQKSRHVLKPVLQVDTGNVNIRQLNAQALDRYSKSPDFSYRVHARPGLSWWDRFWIWFWELMASIFGGHHSSGPSTPFLKYVLEAAAIALLIFIIVKLFGLHLTSLFGREPKQIKIPYTESLENIHQITFDEEIEKALATRNYKLAIRLLYLNTLKLLNDAQLINWQIEKTNSAYLNELADSNQRQSFTVLTRQFEYVWYGDFPVDGASYQNISTLFNDFKKKLV